MQNYGGSNPEMFSLQTGMEMLGMATTSKNNFNHGGDLSGQQPKYYHHHQQSTAEINDNLVVVDDSSLRCLFPTQGPSLSLCNSTQGLIRGEDGFLMSLQGDFFQQQQEQGQGSFLLLQLSSCKYLIPTQELLKEFCNVLPTSLEDQKNKNKNKVNNTSEEEQEQSSSSSPWNHHHHLQSLDIPELQIRKARLLAMLEEVDRRFAKYCDQMRGVVSSFEAVTGEGFAAVYTTLASKAMSKHFRCLRDGIVGQIKVTGKAMAEKEQMTTTTARTSSTTTRGDQTPRLKLPDQCTRQHKAFRQGHSSEISHHHPWRPQRGLPERSVSILRAWLFEHFLNPYPSDVDKHILARQTGLSRSQVSNWFVNARVRLWKPMVEEMYMEETKEEDNQSSSSQPTTTTTETTNGILLQCPNPNYHYHGHDDDDKDQKPDQGSLSSIVNGSSFAYQFQTPTDDFSGGNRRFGSSSVSLTLGLQQHSGGGINGSGAMGNVNQSLFYSRSDDQQQQQQQQQNVENYRSVSFDGEAPQMNIPPPPPLNYRNLMGAQLLRDFSG